jgi:hypothetical protein
MLFDITTVEESSQGYLFGGIKGALETKGKTGVNPIFEAFLLSFVVLKK